MIAGQNADAAHQTVCWVWGGPVLPCSGAARRCIGTGTTRLSSVSNSFPVDRSIDLLALAGPGSAGADLSVRSRAALAGGEVREEPRCVGLDDCRGRRSSWPAIWLSIGDLRYFNSLIF